MSFGGFLWGFWVCLFFCFFHFPRSLIIIISFPLPRLLLYFYLLHIEIHCFGKCMSVLFLINNFVVVLCQCSWTEKAAFKYHVKLHVEPVYWLSDFRSSSSKLSDSEVLASDFRPSSSKLSDSEVLASDFRPPSSKLSDLEVLASDFRPPTSELSNSEVSGAFPMFLMRIFQHRQFWAVLGRLSGRLFCFQFRGAF